ncbi:MAG TPA: hypothetical protein VGD45_03245 [Steroidobacter sp.]|uniref:hypothetical protein n=1 Tax=Steroidobacter sp. TaxID=1978227 RepID=UPI002EDB86C9
MTSKRPSTWNAPTRREVMIGMAMAGVGVACGPAFASTRDLASHAHDWDWLIGDWDVWHRRLKDRLAGSNEWQEFNGKSALWLTLNGLGTLDDNIVELPDGIYRGLTLRAFDPATRQWAIWWLDGRNPSRIDPPVYGSFAGDVGTFIGKDVFKGQPITVRFRWQDIHSKRPHWEQSFSTDGGKTWEVNWRNYFTRTNSKASPLARIDSAPRDFDSLVGTWQVRNRRLKQRLVGSTQWEEFDNTLVNRAVLGGFGNVGDNVFHAPGGTYCGLSLRAYDSNTREWLSWWLDGRSPTRIGSPMRGSFKDGIGTLLGDDVYNGKPIKIRSQWSKLTAGSAHWEQASSADGGRTWETNWVSELTRKV